MSANVNYHTLDTVTEFMTVRILIIILVLPPGVVCRSNRAVPVPGTADGDTVSRCQILGRAGSVHHGEDPWVLHGLPDATVTCFLFVGKSPL